MILLNTFMVLQAICYLSLFLSILAFILAIKAIRRKDYFGSPPLTEDEIVFIDKEHSKNATSSDSDVVEKLSSHEKKLDNLLTKEDEDLIDEYYQGMPSQ